MHRSDPTSYANHHHAATRDTHTEEIKEGTGEDLSGVMQLFGRRGRVFPRAHDVKHKSTLQIT